MKKDRELQLLVCSANLGNEQPDDDSLADLIPEDGRCTQVLKTPQTYPIRTIREESKSNGDDDDGEKRKTCRHNCIGIYRTVRCTAYTPRISQSRAALCCNSIVVRC